MTSNQLYRIIKQLHYKNWTFHIEERKDCFVLQMRFMAYNPAKPNTDMEPQSGRKWFLSKHACKAEVVRTAFKAVLAAEEHEACEHFWYKGTAIHSPHLDPDAVARVYQNEAKPLNKRKRQR